MSASGLTTTCSGIVTLMAWSRSSSHLALMIVSRRRTGTSTS
ncbi:MAG: hypothetical protein ACRDK7_07225 [Solirubrobacteraceae bacterium]